MDVRLRLRETRDFTICVRSFAIYSDLLRRCNRQEPISVKGGA